MRVLRGAQQQKQGWVFKQKMQVQQQAAGLAALLCS
jgi:hypothetical protein